MVQDRYGSVGREVKVAGRVGVVPGVLESGEGVPERGVDAFGLVDGDQLSTELAEAMAATGTAEPELAAALAIAAYRTVHLQAIRRVLAGEDAATVAARHPGRIRSALSMVDQMTHIVLEIPSPPP